MQLFVEPQPLFRWSLLFCLFLAATGIYGFVLAANMPFWITALLLPAMVALLWLRSVAGISLSLFTLLLFLLYSIQEPDPDLKTNIFYHLPVFLAMATIAWLYRQRLENEKNVERQNFATIKEQLALAREQYKIDLLIKMSNQKKIQKYSLLGRVSRVLGSQLHLDKLADVVIHEVQEIIGPERGSYLFALDLPDQREMLARSLPLGKFVGDIMEDGYGIWAVQHRSTLLVSDTHNDFRFQSPPADNPLRSLMMAPMLSDGKVIGLLRAESPWPGMFVADDLRLFAIISDLASVAVENAHLYQKAQALAITDGLTGLYLRRFFNQRFEEELCRFQEHQTTFSLLILDLDHFKRINDRLGHVVGDHILAKVAEVLRAEARVADIVCRFGGEEFALLLPNTPAEGGLVMAERIRSKIALRGFTIGEESIHLTVSVGVGECPRHGTTIHDLVKATDEALYSAKRFGRNNVMIAGNLA